MPARPTRPGPRRCAALALLSSLVFASVGCERQPAAPTVGVLPADAPPPNIIFLLIDTLRADRLATYGHTGNLTPTMDALAAEGVTCDRAIAQAPWTQPSIASLFCSYYPGVHKVVSYKDALEGAGADAGKARVLGEQFTTLAELLRARGYLTAAFVANPFVVPALGFAQGFDHFDASFARNTTPGNVVNDATIAWLRQRDASRPLFLYLHYMDAHGPYDAEPRFLEPLLDAVERLPAKRKLTDKEMRALNYLFRPPSRMNDPARQRRLMRYREYWVARYEAGVRQVDHHLANLRERLSEMGLWQNAYVILTADHGEALCEHGIWDHGLSLHHDQLHVPLILRWPGVLPAGKRVAQTVRLIDVLPTLLAQLRLPPVNGIQGVSLLPCLAGRPPAAPPAAMGEAVKYGPEQKALYRGDWKLLRVQSRPPRQFLYNIAQDPLEQRNAARANPGELGALIDALQQLLIENQRLAARVAAREVPLDEQWRRRLQALGYVGTDSAPATVPATQPQTQPSP